MLLAYYFEEDPSILNSEGKRTYTEYNENNERYSPLDDEGNPLKSIPYCESLIKTANKNHIADILIYDEQGRVICSTEPEWYFVLSHNPEDQSYKFREVIDRKLDYYVQPPMSNDIGLYREYIGTAFRYYTCLDKNGNTLYVSRRAYDAQQEGTLNGEVITEHSSMLQLGLDSELLASLKSSVNVNTLLDDVHIMNDGFLIAFDTSDEHNIVYSPFGGMNGKTSSDLGLSSNAFSGNYSGFHRINGSNQFMCIRLLGSYYISAVIPAAALYELKLPIAAAVALIGIIFLFVISVLTLFTTASEERAITAMRTKYSKRASSKATEDGIISIVLPSGRRAESVRAASRWNSALIPWKDRTPEQKLSGLSRYALIFAIFALIAASTYITRGSSNDSVLEYIMSGDWDRSPNIFSFTACTLLSLTVYVFVSIAIKLMIHLCSMLGTKSETIGHLFISILKYGSVITTAFFCIYLVGVDSSSLIASAGIMSLILGFGAQKLIGDILAGIFIVFEGEFRVGDVITIDSFRGQVLDIGLRTTKVIDDDNNIKIFNNSEISGVLNMTKEVSIVKGYINLSYDVPLEQAEEILKKEAPTIRKNLPMAVNGPFYRGVTELADSSVVLRVDMHCAEKDYMQLERDFNRELYLAWCRNGLDMPYTTITITKD
ncbi:MAG: mechanosensitive ion channel family protein [Eubacteriales bacterium]|nr:mechanosensitive ion channel family protein [Eubacteriales bacterium]